MALWLWNAKTATDLHTIDLPRTIDRDVPIALLPDGRHVLMGGKGLRVFDVETGEQVQRLFEYFRVAAIAATAKGTSVVIGGRDDDRGKPSLKSPDIDDVVPRGGQSARIATRSLHRRRHADFRR
jgi:hypothetical protein